jgi:xanthine dehydrogenase molybdenum-binding subunit
MSKEYFDFIGKDFSTSEISEKVRGITKFSTDYYFEDMLYLKLSTSKPDPDLLRIDGIVDIFKVPELPYVMICAVSEKSLKNAIHTTEQQPAAPIEASEKKISFSSDDLKMINNPIIIEGKYSTASVFSPYLEPEGGVAYIEDRVLTVICPGTDPHKEQQEISQLLKLPQDSVKVINPSSRASYGGAGHVPIHLYLAIGAYKTGKPVKLILDSEQTRYTGYSYPIDINIRTSVTEDCTCLGHDITASINSGNAHNMDDFIIERIKSAFCKTYNTSHCNLELTVKNSENHISGSFPGEGYTQSVFALETQLDILSKKCNKDPVDLRIKLLSNNEKKETLIYKKLLQTMKDSDLYKNASLYKRNKDPLVKKGIGVAACMLPVTFKSAPAGEKIVAARILINNQRRYQIEISCPDSGKGTNTVFAQIVSEVIGCGIDKIKTVNGISSLPYPGLAGGRGGTVSIIGEYIRKAAEDLKSKLSANGVSSESLKRPSSIPGKLLNITGLAYHEPVEEEFSGIASIVLLEVNTRYCTMEIRKIENFIYAGTIINPQALSGSIYGAVARSVKYTSGTINCPGPCNMPAEIINHFIENARESREKAFGAKSIAEILGVALTPAILNAFFDSTSKRVLSLPLSPSKIYSFLYGDTQ